MTREPWSKKELEYLEKIYPEHGARGCLEFIERSEVAITQAALRYGVKRKTKPKRSNQTIDRDKIKEMLEDGNDVYDIPDAIGCALSSVRTIISRDFSEYYRQKAIQNRIDNTVEVEIPHPLVLADALRNKVRAGKL